MEGEQPFPMQCYCHLATPVTAHPSNASAESVTGLQVLSRSARPGPATTTAPLTESISSHAKSSPSTHGSNAAPPPPKLPSTRATTPAGPGVYSTAHLRGRPALQSVGPAVDVHDIHQGGSVTTGLGRSPVSVVAPAHPVGSPPADLQDCAAVTVSPPFQPGEASAPSSPKVPILFISKIQCQ